MKENGKTLIFKKLSAMILFISGYGFAAFWLFMLTEFQKIVLQLLMERWELVILI